LSFLRIFSATYPVLVGLATPAGSGQPCGGDAPRPALKLRLKILFTSRWTSGSIKLV